jgi:hypothetical protein
MLYYFKASVPTFFNLNLNLHQLQAMIICYPTIYDMILLALVSYIKILIEWKYPVFPDRILKGAFWSMLFFAQ